MVLCYMVNDIIYINRHILSVSIDTKAMTLTYRGCKYNQEEQAQKDRAWWNLAHRPWLCLTYRNIGYLPYLIGGQIK